MKILTKLLNGKLMKGNPALLSGYSACVLVVISLGMGIQQAFLQDEEAHSLRQISQSLQTGDVVGDIESVVNFVYTEAYLGDGKQGFFRAPALAVLDPAIGGQCGEFVRLTINLLNSLGYEAHRLYLYPTPADGRGFDPALDRSFHVVAEVKAGDRWIVVDPLHGLVFRDESGNLVDVEQLQSDPAIIDLAYQAQPLEVHRTIWNTVDISDYSISNEMFENATGLNWTQLAPMAGMYSSVTNLAGSSLAPIYLPLVAEQPHLLMSSSWLTLSGFGALIAYLMFSRFV